MGKHIGDMSLEQGCIMAELFLGTVALVVTPLPPPPNFPLLCPPSSFDSFGLSLLAFLSCSSFPACLLPYAQLLGTPTTELWPQYSPTEHLRPTGNPLRTLAATFVVLPIPFAFSSFLFGPFCGVLTAGLLRSESLAQNMVCLLLSHPTSTLLPRAHSRFPDAASPPVQHAIALIDAILQFDPARRPTASEALAHTTFTNACRPAECVSLLAYACGPPQC